MRLDQIQYFLMTAQCGSITKAAKQLYISQPALSKQITLLEDEIGVKLLQRQARGIVLTEAGEQFASDCRRICRDLEDAVKRVSAYETSAPAQLKIACFDGAVTDDFLPDLRNSLRQKAPDLQIKLSRNSFAENRGALNDGKVDLVIEFARRDSRGVLTTISGLSEQQEDFAVRILVQRAGALIYSDLSPLAQISDPSMEDFAQQPYLIGKEKEAKWMAEPALAYIQAHSRKKPKIETVENFMTLMTNMELGNGYCSLARSVADHRPELHSCDLPPELGVCVVAVWKRTNQLADQLMNDPV